MDKLLKEAIADAKSVRETALANAKIALEEAFTPHLKSMLSKKLQAEMEGEDEESHDEGYHGEDEEEKMDEEMDSSGIGAADNKEPEEEAGDTSDIGQGPESEGSDEEGGNEDENMEDAPDQPMGEGYGMEDEDEEPVGEEMEDEDEDLEEVLRQLEAEMADEDEEEAPAEGMHDEEEVEEAMEDEDEDKVEEGEHMEDEDEEIDLDEIIKALTEEEGMEDEDEEVAEEMEDEDSELEEYKKTVLYLKNKLSEVNLLNAKLLYTNKLFRSRNISEAQKMKVIEQFDRTTSVREVKLVYSTFAESIKRKPVNESRRVSKASKPVASTKSKKPIIGENTDFKSRMKKLANII